MTDSKWDLEKQLKLSQSSSIKPGGRPPEFPRPSSSIAKNRLKNRIVLGTNANKPLSSPNKRDRNIENNLTPADNNIFVYNNDSVQINNEDDDKDEGDKFNPNISEIMNVYPGSTMWRDDISVMDSVYESNSITVGSQYGHNKHYQSTLTVPGAGSLVIKQKKKKFQSNGSNFRFDSSMYSYSNSSSQLGASSQLLDIEGGNSLMSSKKISLELTEHVAMPIRLREKGWNEIVKSIAHGDSEFCYLKPIPGDPYVFKIIGLPDDLQSDPYVTLSKNGIVRNDGSESEHLSLHEFMREHDIYHKIKKIHLFKNYRLWKTIYVWKKGSSRIRFNKTSNILKSKFFMFDNNLIQMLLHVKNRCMDLSRLRIMKYEALLCYDIDEFVTLQQETFQQSCKVKSKILHNMIITLSKEGEKHALDSFSNSHSIVSLSTLDNNNNMKSLGPSNDSIFTESQIKTVTSGDDYSFNEASNFVGLENSIIEEDEDFQLSYTEKSTIRGKCRRLAGLLRLFDFMLRDVLYEAVENCLQKFFYILTGRTDVKKIVFDKINETLKVRRENGIILNTISVEPEDTVSVQEILSPIRPVVGLFQVYVTMNTISYDHKLNQINDTNYNSNELNHENPNLLISPSLYYIEETFRKMLTDSLKIAVYENSLLNQPRFLELLVPISNEISCISLDDRLNSDKDISVHYLIDMCCKVLTDDFQASSTVVNQYDFLTKKRKENLIFLETMTFEKISLLNVDDMDNLLIGFQLQIQECNKMEDYHNIGLFKLDFTEVKNMSILMLESCKKLLFKLIPDLYLSKGEIICTEMFRIKSLLGSRPTNLDDFVKLLKVHKIALEKSDKLLEDYTDIIIIKDLIENKSIPINEATQRLNLSLPNVNYQYSEAMLEFEENLEESIIFFKRELKHRFNSLLKPLNDSTDFLNTKLVLDPDSDADTVLAKLKIHSEIMNTVWTKCVLYNSHQQTMQVNVFNYEPIVEVIKELSINIILWKEIKGLKSYKEYFLNSIFLDANCFSVEKALRDTLTILTENTTENIKVFQWLGAAVSEMKSIVPCIENLQSASLKERHINAIHKCLKIAIFEETDLTVGELLNHGLNQVTGIIHNVYQEACYEHEIELKLTDLKKSCKQIEFKLSSDSDNKSLVHISNFTELFVFYEDISTTLESCIASKFSVAHKKQLDLFQVNVIFWFSKMKEMIYFQEGFLQLRIVFTSPRTARHLITFLKKFQKIDDFYRFMISHIKNETKITTLLETEEFVNLLPIKIEELDQITVAISEYIDDMCSKWPKLYLLSKNTIFDALSTQDPLVTFKKCNMIFPNVSGIVLDHVDQFNVIGITSGSEYIKFLKPCSGRTSLVDWFRSIDSCLSECISFGVKMYMDENKLLIDDLRNSTCCDQSRINSLQIKFWFELEKIVQSPLSKLVVLKSFLSSISDCISTLISLVRLSKSKYQYKSIPNAIVLLQCQREYVTALFSDPNINSIEFCFQYVSSIKKSWKGSNSTLKIKHGQNNFKYGFKYQGFLDRLVVTPLTDKCYLAISNSLKKAYIPTTFSQYGLFFAQETFKGLACEFGNDSIFYHCSLVTSIEILFNTMKASVGSGIWFSYVAVETMSTEHFSKLLISMNEVHNCINAGDDNVEIDNSVINIADNHNFSLIFNAKKSATQLSYFPASMRLLFRPIRISLPNRRIVLNVILLSYGYHNYSKLSIKCDEFIEYLVTHRIFKENFVMTRLILSVRKVGENLPVHQDSYKQVNDDVQSLDIVNIIQDMIQSLPHNLISLIDKDHLDYISNMFLEIKLNTKDFDNFLPTEINILKESKQPIHDMLKLNMMGQLFTKVSSVIVLGGSGFGKSAMINKVCDEIYKETSKIPATFEERELNKPILQKYPHIISPDLIQTEYNNDSIQVANDALHAIIKSFDSFGKISKIIHLDICCSHQLVPIFNASMNSASILQKRIKFVWECCELSTIDPHLLTNCSIIYLNEKLFSLKDLIQRCISIECSSDGRILKALLTTLVEKYLDPCIEELPSDLTISSSTLCTNVFSIFDAIYLSSGITHKKWDAESVERIFIYACIWTFGVYSSSSRITFEAWFSSKYYDDFLIKAASYNGIKIYTKNCLLPPSSNGCGSIFDFYLEKSNDGNELYWTSSNPFLLGNIQIDNLPGLISINKLEKMKRPLPRFGHYKSRKHAFSTVYGQAYSESSILIPTPTGDALKFLYSCMTNSNSNGGHIMLYGLPGSGVSSLVRQLELMDEYDNTNNLSINPSKRNNENYRWICHLSDCDPSRLRSYIKESKCNTAPILIERNLPELGSIIIEDVNISNMHNSSSSSEWIRSVTETKEDLLYSSIDGYENLRWKNYGGIFTLITGKSINCVNSEHSRLIAKQIIISTHENELIYSLATKFQSQFPNFKDDIHEDLVILTMKMVEIVKKNTQEQDPNISLPNTHCNDDHIHINHLYDEHQVSQHKKHLHGRQHYYRKLHDEIFIKFLNVRSVTATVDNIIANISSALSTLPVYSSNDAIRVWNRVFTDYTSKFDDSEDKLHIALNFILDNTLFKFPSFVELVNREQSTQADAKALHIKTIKNNALYSSEDAVCTSAFYKNSPKFHVGILSSDYLREQYLEKNKFIPSNINIKANDFWQDVQQIAGQLMTLSDQDYRMNMLIIGSSLDLLSDIIKVACNCSTHIDYIVHGYSSVDSVNQIKEILIKKIIDGYKINAGLIENENADGVIFNQTAYHIHFTQDSVLTVKDMIQLHDIFQLKNDDIVNRLIFEGLPNPNLNHSIREFLSVFIKQISVIFSFASWNSVKENLHILSKVPDFTKYTRILSLAKSYCIDKEYLVDKYSENAAKAILNTVEAMENYVVNVANSTDGDAHIASSIKSHSYRVETIQFIHILYDLSNKHGEKWKEKYADIINTFSIKSRFNAYSVERVRNKRENNTILEVLTANKIIEGELSEKLIETNANTDSVLLSQAVFNVLYMRYLMNVTDEKQSSAMQNMEEILKNAGFSFGFKADLDSIPLATAATFSHLYPHCSNNNLSLTKIMKFASNLPESRGRKVLNSICLSFIIDSYKDIKFSNDTEVNKSHYSSKRWFNSTISIIDQSGIFAYLFQDIFDIPCIERVHSIYYFPGKDRVYDIFNCSIDEWKSGHNSSKNNSLSPENNFFHEATCKGNNQISSSDSVTTKIVIHRWSPILIDFFVMLLISRNYDLDEELGKLWIEKSNYTDVSINKGPALLSKLLVDSFKSISSKVDLCWTNICKKNEKTIQTLSSLLLAIDSLPVAKTATNSYKRNQFYFNKFLFFLDLNFKKDILLYNKAMNNFQNKGTHSIRSSLMCSEAIYCTLDLISQFVTVVDFIQLQIIMVFQLNLYGLPEGHIYLTKIFQSLITGEGPLGMISIKNDNFDNKVDYDSDNDEEKLMLTPRTDSVLLNCLSLVTEAFDVEEISTTNQAVSGSVLGKKLSKKHNIAIANQKIALYTSIKAHIGDWSDWVMDASTTDLYPAQSKYSKDATLTVPSNWIEHIVVTYNLKPDKLRSVLLLAIVDLGLKTPVDELKKANEYFKTIYNTIDSKTSSINQPTSLSIIRNLNAFSDVTYFNTFKFSNPHFKHISEGNDINVLKIFWAFDGNYEEVFNKITEFAKKLNIKSKYDDQLAIDIPDISIKVLDREPTSPKVALTPKKSNRISSFISGIPDFMPVYSNNGVLTTGNHMKQIHIGEENNDRSHIEKTISTNVQMIHIISIGDKSSMNKKDILAITKFATKYNFSVSFESNKSLYIDNLALDPSFSGNHNTNFTKTSKYLPVGIQLYSITESSKRYKKKIIYENLNNSPSKTNNGISQSITNATSELSINTNNETISISKQPTSPSKQPTSPIKLSTPIKSTSTVPVPFFTNILANSLKNVDPIDINLIKLQNIGDNCMGLNENDNFILMLTHSLTIISGLPFVVASSSEHQLLLARFRWILVISHTSILCRFKDLCFLGDDTLIIAINMMESYINLPQMIGNIRAQIEINEVDYFVEVLLETLYYQHSNTEDHLAIYGILVSYFSTDCLDFTDKYFIQGKVQIPKDFSETSIHTFLHNMKSALVETFGINDIIGCASVVPHCRERKNIDLSINRYLSYSNVKLDSIIYKHDFDNEYFINRMKKIVINTILPKLPELIVFNSKIDENMRLNCILNSKEIATIDPTQSSARASVVLNRRKRGVKQVKKVVTREYDPIWLYVLSEYRAVNKSINEINEKCCSLFDGTFISKASDKDIIETLHKLEIGLVPKSWIDVNYDHKFNSDGSDKDLNITLENFISDLIIRRRFIFNWLNNGYPDLIHIHLLQSSRGLIHALVESAAFKLEVDIDRIFVQYSVISNETAMKQDLNQLTKLNNGCAVILTDVKLINGCIDDETCILEFESECVTHNYGQDVAVQINVGLDETVTISDDYQCPFFINSILSDWMDRPSIANIQMQTAEDSGDCTRLDIKLVSQSKWLYNIN